MELNNLNTQPPTQAPVPPPVAIPPPVTPASLLSQIKPSPPNDFDGDWAHSCAFLTSTLLFAFIIRELDNEQTRIHWVLSFFKSDLASIFAQRVICDDALLSALAKEQQTHSTKTNKQKGALANAPIGPLEHSWAWLLTESERKWNKVKENDLINNTNNETDDGQLGWEYYGDELNADCGEWLMMKLGIVQR